MESRAHFHAELDALKGRVVALSVLVETARQGAVAAYRQNDQTLARQIIEGDKAINQQTCDIDEACLKLLALEQPVALDLRRIVGYARAVINFERLGDEAVNIAEGALAGAGLPGECDGALMELSDHVAGMLVLASRSFVEDDVDAAMDVCRLDERARELAVAAMRCITEALSRCQAAPEDGVRAILACRSFERMAGHAANLGEILVFIVKGVILSQKCQPR
ncbi:MAG: phosphate transport system regulatory protein PhoU [Solidesulfovibrio magneticus str. Maddingley MBC34]|uniref:Phosphate-specific transport system accessory protein PhoU n=1 Tax=Solidesulfovibrio magneticus str. Maddingley MBC34 TaxID=1206767 RepID=K6GT44_9BACT|nr:MAG: phosphate transport system regulatory protein PhoU [Solidesulfovibrio magneticus str. Maddingley MBC34]